MVGHNPQIEMKRSDSFYEKDEEEKHPIKQNPSFHDIEKEEEEDDDDDDGSQEVDHNFTSAIRPRNGSTSSNSTVEEISDKKPSSATGSVRPYVRSKNPRLRWTPELHLRFIHAIERLGGQERATPKMVLQLMNVRGLSISHVKSHLQMYRSKKIEDPNQEQGLLYEGDDHHIYNLSQLPMLHSYNPRSLSNFRYQDGLWSPQANLNYNPYMGGLRHGVYGSPAERIFASNKTMNSRPSFNQDHASWRSIQSNNIEESQLGFCKNLDGLSTHNQIRRKINQMETNPIIKDHDQEKRVLKRMKVDHESGYLDLNLSLKVKIPEDEHKNNEERNDDLDETNLSLSLFLSNSDSYSSSIRRSKHARTMGTSNASLDLTL